MDSYDGGGWRVFVYRLKTHKPPHLEINSMTVRSECGENVQHWALEARVIRMEGQTVKAHGGA